MSLAFSDSSVEGSGGDNSAISYLPALISMKVEGRQEEMSEGLVLGWNVDIKDKGL